MAFYLKQTTVIFSEKNYINLQLTCGIIPAILLKIIC